MVVAILQQWICSPKAIATAIFLVILNILYYGGLSASRRTQAPSRTQQQGLQLSAEQEEELIRRRRLAVEKQQAQLEAAAAAAMEKRAQQEQAERVLKGDQALIGVAYESAQTPPHRYYHHHHRKHGSSTLMRKQHRMA